MQILIDVSAETRLQEFGIVGVPFLSKIVDDHGQTLSVAETEAADPSGVNTVRFGGLGNGNGNGNFNAMIIVNGNMVQVAGNPIPTLSVQRSVAVRVKLGEKSAKYLKEVSGKLSVQALNAPEVLVKVDGVLGAAGQSFVGKDGNAIHMQTVEKLEDGSYRIRLAVENPAMQDPFALRNMRGRGNWNGNFNNNVGIPVGLQAAMPRLMDAAGKEFLAEIASQGTTLNANGQVVQNAVLVYRPVRSRRNWCCTGSVWFCSRCPSRSRMCQCREIIFDLASRAA